MFLPFNETEGIAIKIKLLRLRKYSILCTKESNHFSKKDLEDLLILKSTYKKRPQMRP